MKILLVKPYNVSDHIQPSLGLGYLATACREKGHDVAIIDCIKEGLRVDYLIEKIGDLKADMIGVQCYTFDLNFVKEILERCKGLNRNMYTAIGGPHPSATPKMSFEYFKDSLDFVFVGEAEKSLQLLLDKLEGTSTVDFAQIGGLAWRDGGSLRVNPQVFTEDLDTLGMPAWDLIHPERYPESQHGAFFKKFPIAPVMFTRGCPFPCTFCAGSIVAGKRIRAHSIDFMLREIRYLYDTHGIREFHVVDDNFTFDRNYVKEFLRRLITLDLDISWATPNGVRIDTLDEELLELMKKSGMYLISLGIESGSDRILGLMKKQTTVKKIRDGISLIRSRGIDIAGFFIMGFPGESREDIEKTIRFSLELDLIRANYFTYLPFPGSTSYNELKAAGQLGDVDWDRFYFMNAPYVPKGMARSGLKALQQRAFFRFYFRPAIFWKNLKQIRSFRHFKYLLKRFFHWIIMK
ncbi:B12-binding domain-containing radical SAM protein [Omnitrophica bacterium]|nr:B12-binding domain-containing radical SAM protein [Candidatus Omnitrophota bacterium]